MDWCSPGERVGDRRLKWEYFVWAGWMSHAPGPTFSRYSPGECGGERNEQQALVRGACAQCWSRGRGNLPMKMYERGARRPASRFGSLHSIEEPQKCESARVQRQYICVCVCVCVCAKMKCIHYRTVHPPGALQYLRLILHEPNKPIYRLLEG